MLFDLKDKSSIQCYASKNESNYLGVHNPNFSFFCAKINNLQHVYRLQTVISQFLYLNNYLSLQCTVKSSWTVSVKRKEMRLAISQWYSTVCMQSREASFSVEKQKILIVYQPAPSTLHHLSA